MEILKPVPHFKKKHTHQIKKKQKKRKENLFFFS
jgi:hypothetical protein